MTICKITSVCFIDVPTSFFMLISFSLCICFCSRRVVVRQRWRKASSSQTPSIHHRRSPREETSPLIKHRYQPLLPTRCHLRTGRRRKLPTTSRTRTTLRPIPRPSLCGSPFPLCCLSPSTTAALPVRPGTRAARPRNSFSIAMAKAITQVGEVFSLRHFLFFSSLTYSTTM